jgi:hypothetical protein
MCSAELEAMKLLPKGKLAKRTKKLRRIKHLSAE